MVASYDFAGLMKMMASSLRDPKGAASVFADLPPSEPVQFAMSLSEGRLDGRWRMPLAPLAAIAEGARKAAAASPRPTPRPSPKNP
jgi:hypothetical protein